LRKFSDEQKISDGMEKGKKASKRKFGTILTYKYYPEEGQWLHERVSTSYTVDVQQLRVCPQFGQL
jgi:hypothetical protein